MEGGGSTEDTQKVSVNLTAEELKAIRRRAKQAGLTVPDLIGAEVSLHVHLEAPSIRVKEYEDSELLSALFSGILEAVKKMTF